MTETAPQQSQPDWRAYSTKSRMPSIRMLKADLKRLYKIVNDKQSEYRDRFMPLLQQQENEPDEEFRQRKERVYNAFTTSIGFTGANDEQVHGSSAAIIDSDNIPERLKFILISTSVGPRTAIGLNPTSSIEIFIDFTRPPWLDFERLPTFMTPNESNFSISSDNESWFTAARANILDFISERKTSYNWLHSSGLYDGLALFIGTPLSIWFTLRIGRHIDQLNSSNFVKTALYIYSFVFALSIFRILFSYARWVFPKVEMSSERSSAIVHRTVLGAICIGVAASVLWDAIKYLF